MRGPKPEGRFLNPAAEAERSHEPLSHGAGGGGGGAEGLHQPPLPAEPRKARKGAAVGGTFGARGVAGASKSRWKPLEEGSHPRARPPP